MRCLRRNLAACSLLGEAGGMLDLVDSLLLVAPLAWLALDEVLALAGAPS
jgi:hypothetical protein